MMNKKRLLALLLAVVMVIGMIPTVMAADGDDDHIKLNKTVSQGTDSDYLLTLEAFVTVVNDDTAAAGAEVRVIVNAEKNVQNAVLFRNCSKKTAHDISS